MKAIKERYSKSGGSTPSHIIPIADIFFGDIPSGNAGGSVAGLALALPSVSGSLVFVKGWYFLNNPTPCTGLLIQCAIPEFIADIFGVRVPPKILKSVIRRAGIREMASLMPCWSRSNERSKYKSVDFARNHLTFNRKAYLRVAASIGRGFHLARWTSAISAPIAASFASRTPYRSIVPGEVIRVSRYRQKRYVAFHYLILHIPTILSNKERKC